MSSQSLTLVTFLHCESAHFDMHCLPVSFQSIDHAYLTLLYTCNKNFACVKL